MNKHLICKNIIIISHWSNAYTGYLISGQSNKPLHHIRQAINYLKQSIDKFSNRNQKRIMQIDDLAEQLEHSKLNKYGDLQTKLLGNPTAIAHLAHYLYYDYSTNA